MFIQAKAGKIISKKKRIRIQMPKALIYQFLATFNGTYYTIIIVWLTFASNLGSSKNPSGMPSIESSLLKTSKHIQEKLKKNSFAIRGMVN